MKIKDKLTFALCVLLSVCVVSFSAFCVYNRVGAHFSLSEDTAFWAVFSTMPNGSIYEKKQGAKSTFRQKEEVTSTTLSKTKTKDTHSHVGENTYDISEISISQGDISYDNFSVKNTTSYSMDIEALLNDKLDFDIKDTRQAQVLIVHTHTCESYMDEDSGFYYESFYPRTTDNSMNVCAVGEKIAEKLKAKGIGVIHAKQQHDYPSYDGAYSRSYDTIMKYLDKYKEIKVVLDIHRDSMTQEDNTKLKPTFTYNGKKAAQIMIMSGYGGESFPFWQENLKFALKLQSTCETMYPGMTRPLYFGNFTYNMNVNSGSLLIEVGTDANTLDEALYTGEMLGNALAQVLQNA